MMNDDEWRMSNDTMNGSQRLTVKDEAHQRLAVFVQDLPKGKGLKRRVRQQPEEQRDGVVRGKTFWVDDPAGWNGSKRSPKGQKEETGFLQAGPWGEREGTEEPGWLGKNSLAVQVVAREAVEGSRHHRNTRQAAVAALFQAKQLHHPETWAGGPQCVSIS